MYEDNASRPKEPMMQFRMEGTEEFEPKRTGIRAIARICLTHSVHVGSRKSSLQSLIEANQRLVHISLLVIFALKSRLWFCLNFLDIKKPKYCKGHGIFASLILISTIFIYSLTYFNIILIRY